MRTPRYTTKDLIELLERRNIATMEDMKAALGTQANITVLRKLKELSYRTSYSHRGRYYTLDDIAAFDELGLWCYESACFSIHGTLLATAEAFVEDAEAGCYPNELELLLHVGVQDALRKLVRDERLVREKVSGKYLYCSQKPGKRGRQLENRRIWLVEPGPGEPLPDAEFMHDELKAAIVLFFSLLDEKQRRIYAGLESLKAGHGGDRRIADLLGLDVGTVARGRRQLISGDFEVERTRRPGGGRKPVEKKTRR